MSTNTPSTNTPSIGNPTDNPIVADSSDSSAKRLRRRISGYQILLILLATGGVGLTLFVLIQTTGYVQGTEFAPSHFQTRRFTFYEIPLFQWQITPIRRTSTTPKTSVYLTQSKWVPAPKGPPEKWHLVEISRGIKDPVENDAALLVKHLRLTNNGTEVWKQWSKDHPKLAAELWPVIAKLADRELYILIPRLLELTRDVNDVPQLREAITGYLADQYVGLISDMRDAGSMELADALLAEALSDMPNDPDLNALKRSQ